MAHVNSISAAQAIAIKVLFLSVRKVRATYDYRLVFLILKCYAQQLQVILTAFLYNFNYYTWNYYALYMLLSSVPEIIYY